MRKFRIQNKFKSKHKYLVGEIEIIKLILTEKLLNGEKIKNVDLEILDVFEDLYVTNQLLISKIVNKENDYIGILFKVGVNEEEDSGKQFSILLDVETSLGRILKFELIFETF